MKIFPRNVFSQLLNVLKLRLWKVNFLNLVPPSVRKIEFEKSKSCLFHFREYVSTTLLQSLQPPKKVSSIFKLFLRTLGSALLSLTILATNAFERTALFTCNICIFSFDIVSIPLVWARTFDIATIQLCHSFLTFFVLLNYSKSATSTRFWSVIYSAAESWLWNRTQH